jgi:WD40 repeat protein
VNEEAFGATPYKGLVPYSEEDAPFFFGREEEQLVITSNLMASRLTLLYGQSGVGKSSVLRAGVAHRLRQLARENLDESGSPQFAIIVFSSWRDDPIDGLQVRARESAMQSLNGQTVKPVPQSRSLVEVFRAWSARVGGELLVILDQFEEYFLYHGHEVGPDTFAVQFPGLVNSPDLSANFLISIRDDALSKLDFFQGRIPALFDNRLGIDHLDRDAAREAVIKPIEQFNRLYAGGRRRLSIEPELVETVLNQVKTGEVVVGETGLGVVKDQGTRTQIETPYLQLVMTRLWEEEMRKGSRALRLETLKKLGGSKKIVSTHLDATMQLLTQNEKQIAAKVFNHLVTPSGTKIAHFGGDLADYTGLPKSQVTALLEKLSEGKVRIVRQVDSASDEPRYEIFHDVLASAILDWRARHVMTTQRKRVVWLKLGVIGLFLLLIAMVAMAVYAWGQKNAAQRAIARQQAHEVAANALSQLQVDPLLSLLLANHAARDIESAEVEYALRKSLIECHVRAVMSGHKGDVTRVVFSPDGNLLATASTDNTARIWNPTTGKEVAVLGEHSYPVSSVAFSPDSKLVVTASEDHTARVWDASTGKSLHELRGHGLPVNSATFSPDGKFVVTASDDNSARVWDVGTGESLHELKGHSNPVKSATFSPDGRFVVTASEDKTAWIWEAGSGKALHKLKGHKGLVTGAMFSPDGKFVITVSDKSAKVWETTTGKSVVELTGHTREVTSAVFSPNGKFVVTASRDKTARVWETTTGRSQAVLREHTDWVNSAVFSPDGNLVVTTSDDGTALVSEASTMRNLIALRGHAEKVNSAAFSPDGRLVVTVSLDATARVWDVSSERGEALLPEHPDFVNSAMFSPDGKFIVTASRDGARVWDVSAGKTVVVLRGHNDWVNSAAFSSDGRFVVTSSRDGRSQVWNANTWQSVKLLSGPGGYVNSAMFSPDGNLLVTANEEGLAQVWATDRWEVVAELRGHNGQVVSAAFSLDGKLIVTASKDKTARVWDTNTWQSIGVLEGHGDEVNSAMFSPDGKMIVTASKDRTARVWETGSWREVAVLRGHTRGLGSAAFSPNGKLVLTASWDSTARLWEVSKGQSLSILRGHTADLNSAAFNPDGLLLVTASKDNTARVYACEASGSLRDLLSLAQGRLKSAGRKLTPEELERFLHGTTGH